MIVICALVHKVETVFHQQLEIFLCNMSDAGESAILNAISTLCTRSHLATTKQPNLFQSYGKIDREKQPILYLTEYIK